MWYLEDSGAWPYNPVLQTVGEDCTYNVHYLRGIMAEFGLETAGFIATAPMANSTAPGKPAARDLIRNADLLVNVSQRGLAEGLRFRREAPYVHRWRPDVLPGESPRCPATPIYAARVKAHDSHFTFA